MENPIRMDDLGVPPFSETSISFLHQVFHKEFKVQAEKSVGDVGPY